MCTPAVSQQCHLMVQACLPIGLPRLEAATCWQEHACSCLSGVPELSCSDSKSPVYNRHCCQVPAVPHSTIGTFLHVSVPPHGGVEVPVCAFQVPGLGSADIPVWAHILSQR